MKKFITTLVFTLMFSSGTNAGVYTDDLARCIVDNTLVRDRIELVRFIYIAMSQHSDIKHLSNISSNQADDSLREVAHLLTVLLTRRCKDESTKALKYEGELAYAHAFEVLGGVAMQDLMGNRDVKRYYDSIENYLDHRDFADMHN